MCRPNGQEKGVKVKLNPHKISFLVHASEWKYELRRKTHRLIDEKSQRYLEAPREDVEEITSESDNEADYVPRAPEPVVTRLDPLMQGSAYQSYNRDQMIQSRPGAATLLPFVWVSPYTQPGEESSSSEDPYNMTALH
ncbi:hypothetical protein L1987_49217 [Smallanthus sonchifolius]|uniref:Uncharacterized protein n=1 Tax=Smallanthus sonchifolius TaxID=185202 RepID=A0ACB9FUQ5_9ASTR|nr:hypothetical protein L1987_49217 [Smallanthus sonchifolius]